MHVRSLLSVCWLVAACVGHAPLASPPSGNPDPVAAATTPEPLPFEAEQRQILDEMVAVDTSRGDETRLLEPIAERYRRAGVPVQILESAPGRGNLVARLSGTGQKRPLLLTAHVDVVPVDGQPWSVPPFAATEKDGFLWGRGVNDDKGMAATIVAVTLEMARARTPLTRDVVVVLVAGEETGGAVGMAWLTTAHPEIFDAEIALNEGGSVRMSDDLGTAITVGVGVSEKTFQNYRLVVKGVGGHAGVPPTRGDPVVALAHALVRVGDLRFEPRVLPEVRIDLEGQVATTDPKWADALRRVIASAPRVDPADELILRESPSLHAAIHTTCVTTLLQASPQENMLPTTAEATVNCRLLPGDTRASVLDALVATVDDPGVQVIPAVAMGEGPPTPFDGEVIDAITKVAASAFPGARVLPAMSPGATDSRFLRAMGIRAYGVAPMTWSLAEGRAGHIAHGADERRPLSLLAPSARYFRAIVLALVT